MNRFGRVSLALGVLVAALGLAPSSRASGPLVVYDDKLENGFADWSWAQHSLTQSAVVHAGAAAISMEPDGWGGLYFHRDAGIDTAAYAALDFWVNGGASGGQALRVHLLVSGSSVGNAPVASFVAGGRIPENAWAKVHVPFASLGVTSGVLDGFWIMDDTGGNQPAVYLDDFAFLEGATPQPPPTSVSIAVDLNANRRAVSPLIYGTSFGAAAQITRLGIPVRRWGGNSTTRYSFENDTSNRGSDWFFFNIPEDNPNPGALPNGSSADRFIDEARAAGGQAMITVPTIGWTPKDRSKTWGYSVAKYGAQQQTECTVTGGAFWCTADAGNGKRPDGSAITGNDPHDMSRIIAPDFVQRWMQHIASRTGAAGAGGVKLFELDNEPTLWKFTHQDVHPNPLAYDELWQRTRTAARRSWRGTCNRPRRTRRRRACASWTTSTSTTTRRRTGWLSRTTSRLRRRRSASARSAVSTTGRTPTNPGSASP